MLEAFSPLSRRVPSMFPLVPGPIKRSSFSSDKPRPVHAERRRMQVQVSERDGGIVDNSRVCAQAHEPMRE